MLAAIVQPSGGSTEVTGREWSKSRPRRAYPTQPVQATEGL